MEKQTEVNLSYQKVREDLGRHGYICDDAVAVVVYAALRLKRPILVEGPAGVGKTELAKAISRWLQRTLIRLQCYEGLDESKALYEWNYRKQLLSIQAGFGSKEDWKALEQDLFTETFLIPRPLLQAIAADEPSVLLIDEIDKVDQEFEAMLLEILSDWQVSIPELGTVTARVEPVVVLTSNNTRELSEALKRRCFYIYLDYPPRAREMAIIKLKLPDIEERLASQVVEFAQQLRQKDLKKAPSIAEVIDWARTLLEMQINRLEGRDQREMLQATLPVLVKYRRDLDKAADILQSFRVSEDAQV
ncbi:MAG: MoxR family ATPase [Syntrophomonadaceae bacterium]|nr:MoxR family ATPase [Syntrophomonadaceae bacterium]